MTAPTSQYEPNTLVLTRKQANSYAESTARYNIWVGAIRSGKSFASLLRFVKFIRQGPKGPVVIIGKSREAIKRNVIGPLRDLLGSHITYYAGKGEAQVGDRLIHVIGANDERAEHKIRGATFAGAYVDEITIIPESVFQMLVGRLSIKGAQLFGTTNPDSPFHWFKKKFIDRRDELDLKMWEFRLEDNPSLDATFIHNIRKDYQGLWYDRYILGKWVLAEGTVFDFFDRNLHTIDFPPGAAEKYICGIDYGTTNPCALGSL